MRQKEKIVDISEFWDGQGPPKVKIRRITFGETQDIQDEAMDAAVKVNRRAPQIRIGALRVSVLLKALVEAPFPLTPEGIRGLDPELGEFLFKEVDAVNALDPKVLVASAVVPPTEPLKEKTLP